jgi:hypothetical protein
MPGKKRMTVRRRGGRMVVGTVRMGRGVEKVRQLGSRRQC